MRITFWGTRGSVSTPGPETVRYGGETACVAIAGDDPGHLVVLDAGTGIRRLGASLDESVTRVDLLLSHLHLDHIIGLGFFEPLFRPGMAITIWAPPSSTAVPERLSRYLSPPLFPVRLRDVACELELRDAPAGPFERGAFTITSDSIIHPDTALGYRIASADGVVAYLPDHEPALSPSFPDLPDWTSGAQVAHAADLLIHDGQYRDDEYEEHEGWGHSTVTHAARFADLVEARTLALFHHDPGHPDEVVDGMLVEARARRAMGSVIAAQEGSTVTLAA